MNSMLRQSSFTILAVVCATITTCGVSTHNDPWPAPPTSQQTRNLTTTSTIDGFTLGITMYYPWIPGAQSAYSILLEDGEIVSK